LSGSRPDSAIHYFTNATNAARLRKNETEEAATLSNLAYVYVNLNLYDKALKINFELLKLREAAKDSISMGNNYNSISIILSKMHRYDEAIIYSNKAIKLDSLINKKEGLLASYINASAAYSGLHNHNMALYCLNKGKELSIELNDKISNATIRLNMGVVYSDMGELNKASAIFAELVKSGVPQMQDPFANNTLFYNMAEVYAKQNKIDSAKYAYNMALNYAQSVNFFEGLYTSNFGLAEVHAKQGDFKNAYSYLLTAYTVRDTVFSEDKNRTLSELKIGYEVDKKEGENQQLLQQAELKDVQINQQFIIIIALGALLLVILVGGLYLSRQRRIIASQREKILEQKLLQMQLNPHFIFNSLQAIQDYIYSNNEKEASRYLSKFARLMRLTLENSRHENIVLKTEIEGLENYLALQKLRMGNKLDYSINVNENTDATFLEIPPMLIQPFVENAVEHGIKMKDGPGYVKVDFSTVGNMLNIKISDDGPGFKPLVNAKGEHNSLSMQIINERLELFGRKMKSKPNLNITNLDTTHNKGTQVEINIPTEV